MTEPQKRNRHPKYKTPFRFKNWREYEQSLGDRGDITLWISQVAVNAWTPTQTGKRSAARLLGFGYRDGSRAATAFPLASATNRGLFGLRVELMVWCCRVQTIPRCLMQGHNSGDAACLSYATGTDFFHCPIVLALRSMVKVNAIPRNMTTRSADVRRSSILMSMTGAASWRLTPSVRSIAGEIGGFAAYRIHDREPVSEPHSNRTNFRFASESPSM